jgi:hypothetical protein
MAIPSNPACRRKMEKIMLMEMPVHRSISAYQKKHSSKKKKKNAILDIDTSHIDLLNEEINKKIIDSYKRLASAVLINALDDLSSNEEDVRSNAIKFCFSQEHDYREIRLFWLGWINAEEDVFINAARRFLAESSLH